MIADNLKSVRERIERACERAGRDPSQVRIMAVSKSVGVDTVREAIDCGITLFGENRVQEARAKASQGAFHGATLCMIGHLQTNKASAAVRIFDEVHSVDSERAAQALSRYAAIYRQSNPVPVYIEVNVADDPRKHGVSEREALSLVRCVDRLPLLKLQGLMTVAPGYGDADMARNAFRGLRVLRERLIDGGVDAECLRELSMGMSGDFDIAVEEGSTVVRLGTVLFGPRT
ncbi:MAG: YggS family pyridoxal phosphate-dependent enzyme [Bacillota bacterium]|jgi:pyridoxal phosphate enzyme (YggS family)